MIILATDHAGYVHKEVLRKHLEAAGHEILDFGAYSLEPLDDFPDFIIPAAKEVAKDPEKNKAVIFGGSGQGEAMAANRIQGVRATVFYGGPDEVITLSRLHNNANMLSIGGRFVSTQEMQRVVDLWLKTEFQNDERHVRRIKKIYDLSQGASAK